MSEVANGTESSGDQGRPELVHDVGRLKAWLAEARAAKRRIGVVPTMGALHAGHLSLVEDARRACAAVVVTVFVNPTQFGPGEDFEKYPRTLDADLRALGGLADVVFAPATEIMYPTGYSTSIEPPQVARPWEGACRPGHFGGVATIVLKLLHLTEPDAAYFGAKDYQQQLVIRHMVRDLNVPVEIITGATVREADGLAMSSRNRYLSAEERSRALSLIEALEAAARLVRDGTHDPREVETTMQEILRGRVDRLDYAALADPETLEPVAHIVGPVQALLAAHVGRTRLIDNARLEP